MSRLYPSDWGMGAFLAGVDAAMRWKVTGHDDENSCKPCKDNLGHLYRNRESAYADYPGGSGYIKCLGKGNCRCKVVKRSGQ